MEMKSASVVFLLAVIYQAQTATGTKCYNCISRDGSASDCDDPFTKDDEAERRFAVECTYGCFKTKITRPTGGYEEVIRKCAVYPAQESCRAHDVQNANVDCQCNTDYCNGAEGTARLSSLLAMACFVTAVGLLWRS